MTSESFLAKARRDFHAVLSSGILSFDQGVASNADTSNKTSVKIANGIATLLEAKVKAKIAGQVKGHEFERACAEFIQNTFFKLSHLRPGDWTVHQVVGKQRMEIAKYEQYAHLDLLDQITKQNPGLKAALGNDYTITPDIVIARSQVTDAEINEFEYFIDEGVAQMASMRQCEPGLPIMHASISCKWTIRSDRAQNARSEALNLVRNRKGRVPHIIVVTAEPLPSRISSLALGTGDIDCVYHFALHELHETLKTLDLEDAEEMLSIMIKGKRLKDISDLPLDLAV